jgi:hypothetical protein
LVEYSDQKQSHANGRHFQIGRRQNRQNFNVLWFQWKLISIFCFKRGPNRGEVYKRNMCINYFLISAHLSNSITSDNRDPNNALNSNMGVVWGLLCLHPNTIKPRSLWYAKISYELILQKKFTERIIIHNTLYIYSEQWHDIYLIITTCFYKIVLISSIKEGYI